MRAERENYIFIILETPTKENLQWVKEQMKEVKNKYFYFHPIGKSELFPIDSVIFSNEPNDEFLKEGFIPATETTKRLRSEIYDYVVEDMGRNFVDIENYPEIYSFFWEMLNERVDGTGNIISRLMREKDPNILNFCRDVLKNSKNESYNYKSNCYIELRDKHLKQDTELLIDFLQREKNSFPEISQKALQKDLEKLQKKLENNKAKQK